MQLEGAGPPNVSDEFDESDAPDAIDALDVFDAPKAFVTRHVFFGVDLGNTEYYFADFVHRGGYPPNP